MIDIVRFDVMTDVSMKSAIFWYVTAQVHGVTYQKLADFYLYRTDTGQN
jgi:hypothetical protein